MGDSHIRSDPYALAHSAASQLVGHLGGHPFDVALVVGTGWQHAASQLGPVIHSVPAQSIPGFAPSSVPGHSNDICVADVDGARVLVLHARMHLYEGHSAAEAAHPVRAAISAGCRTVILTNAAGTLRSRIRVGDLALIADHINMTGQSPLTGPAPPPGWPDRFTNLVDAYSPRLRRLVRESDLTLKEGVYVGVHGPHLETPAEIRMFTMMGGDFVGMSTVNEAIAAHHLGVEVLGISLITNLAVQIAGQPGQPAPEEGASTKPFGIEDIQTVAHGALAHCVAFLRSAITFRA